MRLTEKIIKALQECLDTTIYFLTMLAKEDFRNHVGKAGANNMHPSKRLAILGNGPSLKNQLPRLIEQKEWEQADMMAVNFFALSEEFSIIKPKYYVISDPMFFREAGRSERIDNLYKALAKVDWQMTLYVQYYNPEKFDYTAAVGNNPNIRIVKFHSTLFHGFRSVEFWCYRHGLGSGNWGTVVQNGILNAIQIGYRTIELYGVDHTLLDGLTVDNQNRLCRIASHYYDTIPAIEVNGVFDERTAAAVQRDGRYCDTQSNRRKVSLHSRYSCQEICRERGGIRRLETSRRVCAFAWNR